VKKWNWKVLALFGLLFFATSVMASSGIVSSQECSQRCQDSYRECKKKETAASAVNDISCAEIREMCQDRCRNITNYVSCKDKCGGDRDCIKNCQQDFKDNVKDYRPLLDR